MSLPLLLITSAGRIFRSSNLLVVAIDLSVLPVPLWTDVYRMEEPADEQKARRRSHPPPATDWTLSTLLEAAVVHLSIGIHI